MTQPTKTADEREPCSSATGWDCYCLWMPLVATLLSATAWPAFAMLCAQPIPDALRWSLHSATFGIHHHLIMPFAVGTFFSTVNPIALVRGWPTPFRQIALIALTGLVGLVAIETVNDAARPGLLPPYLTDADREDVYTFESAERKKTGDQTKDNNQHPSDTSTANADNYNKSLNNYKNSLGINKGGKRSLLTHGNALAGVSIILNLLFGLFVALYFWTFVAGAVGHFIWRQAFPNSQRMLLVFLLLGLWFPLRLYASWYAEHILPEHDWFSNYGALKSLIAVYAIVGLIWCVVLWRVPRIAPKIAGLVFGIIAIVGWGIDKLSPELFPRFLTAVEGASLTHSLIVGIPLLSLIFLTVVASLSEDQAKICNGCSTRRGNRCD